MSKIWKASLGASVASLVLLVPGWRWHGHSPHPRSTPPPVWARGHRSTGRSHHSNGRSSPRSSIRSREHRARPTPCSPRRKREARSRPLWHPDRVATARPRARASTGTRRNPALDRGHARGAVGDPHRLGVEVHQDRGDRRALVESCRARVGVAADARRVVGVIGQQFAEGVERRRPTRRGEPRAQPVQPEGAVRHDPLGPRPAGEPLGDRKWLVCSSTPSGRGTTGNSRAKSPGVASMSTASPSAAAIR